MNYCIVAFGVILLIAVITWIFDGRKHYTGPHVDVEGLEKGQIVGVEGIPESSIKKTTSHTKAVA